MKYFEIFANYIGISHFIAVHSYYFFTVFYFLGTLNEKISMNFLPLSEKELKNQSSLPF